jgi:NAD(P)-dependent dehydrogenase (short-subunit alcohol dehydrogenase family)
MPANGPIDLKKAIDFAALKDRNVLITGGASGLGKSMVHMFADNGANIVIGDIQNDLGGALEKELSGKAKYVDNCLNSTLRL